MRVAWLVWLCGGDGDDDSFDRETHWVLLLGQAEHAAAEKGWEAKLAEGQKERELLLKEAREAQVRMHGCGVWVVERKAQAAGLSLFLPFSLHNRPSTHRPQQPTPGQDAAVTLESELKTLKRALEDAESRTEQLAELAQVRDCVRLIDLHVCVCLLFWGLGRGEGRGHT